MDVKVSKEVSIPAGITSAMRNKKATLASGFCCCCALSGLHETMHRNNKKCRTKYGFLVAHCRGLQGKDTVKRSGCVNPATSNVCDLSAEDSKGKALSEAMQIFLFASRSSQSRQNAYSLFSRSILVPHSLAKC